MSIEYCMRAQEVRRAKSSIQLLRCNMDGQDKQIIDRVLILNLLGVFWPIGDDSTYCNLPVWSVWYDPSIRFGGCISLGIRFGICNFVFCGQESEM